MLNRTSCDVDIALGTSIHKYMQITYENEAPTKQKYESNIGIAILLFYYTNIVIIYIPEGTP